MLERIDTARILRGALAGGGEFAEIYFEDSAFTYVQCEDGKIERLLAASDRGVGIRVIAELCTAYAYSNQLTEEALLQLAETVSKGVRGKEFSGDISLCDPRVGRGYPILTPPGTVPLEEKVALVTRAERAARGFDPRVRQVGVTYRDGEVRIQVANSLGEFT